MGKKKLSTTGGGKLGDIRIPAHSQRVHLAVWEGNGTWIEVLFYQDRQPDHIHSDRIQLIIHPADGKKRGWIMNIEDAVEIIQGLSTAINKALAANIPVRG